MVEEPVALPFVRLRWIIASCVAETSCWAPSASQIGLWASAGRRIMRSWAMMERKMGVQRTMDRRQAMRDGRTSKVCESRVLRSRGCSP